MTIRTFIAGAALGAAELAPLAPGDYVVEIATAGARTLATFHVARNPSG
ncbi:MAG TPA: hypothetical protein VGY57_09650 [Vicinamibacterales bacterium]|nr:hypothetical protein [Vicinamibacterales bacterium]